MRANKVKKYINIYRKSASRFLRGTVLNTLKQSRINIMRGKKGRNIDVQLRQANYVSCFSLRFLRALAASCVLWNRTEHSQDFLFVKSTSTHPLLTRIVKHHNFSCILLLWYKRTCNCQDLFLQCQPNLMKPSSYSRFWFSQSPTWILISNSVSICQYDEDVRQIQGPFRLNMAGQSRDLTSFFQLINVSFIRSHRTKASATNAWLGSRLKANM